MQENYKSHDLVMLGYCFLSSAQSNVMGRGKKAPHAHAVSERRVVYNLNQPITMEDQHTALQESQFI